MTLLSRADKLTCGLVVLFCRARFVFISHFLCFSVWEIAFISFSEIVSRLSHWLRILVFSLSWVSTCSSCLCIETRKMNWKAMHVKRQITKAKQSKERMRSRGKHLLQEVARSLERFLLHYIKDVKHLREVWKAGFTLWTTIVNRNFLSEPGNLNLLADVC